MTPMSASDRPYLSVVATSRNDDHGGDPLRRTQIFMDAFFEQCGAHKLRAELIIVDWNPPRHFVRNDLMTSSRR